MDRLIPIFCSLDDGISGGTTFIDYPLDKTIPSTRISMRLIEDLPRNLSSDETELMIMRLRKSKATTIFCPNVLEPLSIEGKTLIFCENPRLSFMTLVSQYHPTCIGVHEKAIIHDCVEMGKNVGIGAGSVIGGTAYGPWRRRDGTVMRFPQIGKVVIEDNVQIFSNVVIDRGALGETRIGEGSLIGDQVNVSHNVKIGKHCIIITNAVIAGSVTIGDKTWIGVNASILEAVKIGSDCVIGIGSVVLRDVKDGEKVHGVVK